MQSHGAEPRPPFRESTRDSASTARAAVDQRQELFGADLSRSLAPVEEGAGQALLLPVELDDLFFDRVLGDESIHGDGALLADAVGAVGRLRFHRGVPPRVEVNHVVGGGEVQAEAAGFEADEEQAGALPF